MGAEMKIKTLQTHIVYVLVGMQVLVVIPERNDFRDDF